MFSGMDEISKVIKEKLADLKKAKETKDSSRVQQLSSEIVGQARLLLERPLSTKSTDMPLTDEMALLGREKDAAFLLIECFGFVASHSRTELGPYIQQLLTAIYDSANEGRHYLAKDVIFQTHSRIILEARVHFDKIALDEHLPEYLPRNFSDWLDGISSPIRKATRQYFRGKVIKGHAVARVAFEPKKEGAQLGVKAVISFSDSAPPMTFYVKAHQNYSATSSGGPSGSRKALDLKELFVYKVLEHIGLGPKVHFIMHQIEGDTPYQRNALFIATQDVGYSFTPLVKTKSFCQAGRLFTIHREGSREEAVGDESFMSELRSELETSSVGRAKLAATIIDLFARIFHLTDINEGNFGQVVVNGKFKWKIVDFVIDDRGRHEIGGRDSATGGFMTGNGTLRYSGTPFLLRTLCSRPEEEKVIVGHEAISLLERGARRLNSEGRNTPLLTAVTQAFDDVESYMKAVIEKTGETRAITLRIDMATALTDLIEYRRAVVKNFDDLREGLRDAREKLSRPCK